MTKVIRHKLKLTEKGYYEEHLKLMNVLLPVELTGKEVEVLAAFISKSNGDVKDIFNTTSRKEVMKELGLKPGGLSNHLKAIKSKGFIIKDSEGILNVKEFLIPEKDEQYYNLKLEC